MDEIAIVETLQREKQIQQYRPDPFVRQLLLFACIYLQIFATQFHLHVQPIILLPSLVKLDAVLVIGELLVSAYLLQTLLTALCAPESLVLHTQFQAGQRTMPSEAGFKEQLLKVRREIQFSCDSTSLLRTLKDTQRCLELLANEPNHTLCVAHLVKELVDWITLKEDRDLETVNGKACLALYEGFLRTCHEAEKTTRCFLVARLYNAIVTLNKKEACRWTKLQIARHMSQFPITDEQADLFARVKRIVLKMVHETKGEISSQMDNGADLLIEMQRKLLIHEAAGNGHTTDGIRQSALALFREVFDNGMAILCRLYSVNKKKALQLYHMVMDTMQKIVKPSEQELISLLGDSVGYVETIIAYSVGENATYRQFVGFFDIFEPVRAEPYASCYQLIRLLLQLIKQDEPTAEQIDEIATYARTVHKSFPSHELVVRVAIFLTCQSIPYLYRLSQELALGVSHAAIRMCEALMHFVRHCPTDTVPELCRMCTSSRRHLADKLLSTLMHLNIVQARDAVDKKTDASMLSYSASRGCELIKRKLTLLEDLTCERKQSLIDSSMRYSISWLKYIITLLRENGQTANEELEEIAQLLRLLITLQNRYHFEFLSDMHLIRLLEITYTDRTGTDAMASCWANISVRLLKLLVTLRDSTSSASSEEQQTLASISSILRSIMCYQMNAPEEDPIRSLTVIQLYDHPSFDRHGFTFDCVPSRAERFTILAEEVALVIKYKTSNSRPIWEYMLELAKVGDVREQCLTFGMALHGFSENETGKLPHTMMGELLSALKCYRPANVVERVKRSAALAIAKYHAYTCISRSVLEQCRKIPFKVEQLRSGQIDEFLLQNQLDREAQLLKRMEAIRKYYGELMATLEEDAFQSLWVLPSIAQISSILDNTARLYHLNFHPHRAVEMQLLNLRLVSQRCDVRPLDQCASLTFLLEQHELTDIYLKQRKEIHTKEGEKHARGSLESLEDLAKRATSLLPSTGTIDDVPTNRKFQLLNLFLALAVYHASLGDMERALKLIQRALDILNKSANIETIVPLLHGRAAQTIFRLAVGYGLPWPDSVPPFAFMKRMMASFNELQKLASEHTFVLSLATVEMTVEVLQYLILRYETGPLVEPHVEQLLKFVLRRGAGLRVMQLLLMYGQMCADSEKLDRCEIVLSYLDRLLMLSPVESLAGKENGKFMCDIGVAEGNHKAINSLPIAAQSLVEDLVDVEREAAPKNRIIPKISNWDETIAKETVVEQYLMFCHATGCDCRYCRYPQYKTMAFQTAALSVRLSVLQCTKSTKSIESCYETLYEHWRTHMLPNLNTAWTVPMYRMDLIVSVIRMLLHRGQFFVRCERYELALEAYRWASNLTIANLDPALSSDVRYNIHALELLMYRDVNRPKRDRSMIEARYTAMLEKRSKANECSPDMAVLTTNLSNLAIKTPKTATAGTVGLAGRSGVRAPPKTVDRVNELIRQAASRRHQLKSSGTDVLLVPDGTVPSRTYSASARKPKTVNIFVDSPPGRSSARAETVVVPATVGKTLKPSSMTSSVSGKPKAKTVEPEVKLVDQKLPEAVNRRGKRELISESRSVETEPVTPKRSTDSYKDALLSETPSSTPAPPPRPATANKPTSRKVRRLVIDEFPSLSESSDTDASTTKTPSKQTDSSSGLNGSFRDILVLGHTAAKKNDSGVVIVLDDSINDKSGQSEEAIETSFVHSHAVSVDKRTGLSLKTYSDRKRLLGSGSERTPCPPLSASSASSSAARLGTASKRRTPLPAAKTKLRFDDPSPVQQQQQQDVAVVVRDDRTKTQSTEPVEANAGHGKKKKVTKVSTDVTTVSNEKPNGRLRAKKVMAEPVPSVEPQMVVEPRMSTVASRTRLRRKRI
uniref:TPR_REGION domain-containing protein n=1 Tax=Anopheles epiroticus TaxID=199890 RepID=A0A182PQV2_9DIPT